MLSLATFVGAAIRVAVASRSGRFSPFYESKISSEHARSVVDGNEASLARRRWEPAKGGRHGPTPTRTAVATRASCSAKRGRLVARAAPACGGGGAPGGA